MPKIVKQHDSIMVAVDELTKAMHFVPVKTTQKETHIAEIYMKEVARLHGVPKAIVSDRDPKFTSNFWKARSYGKIDRTNKIIEDMLRMYVMDQPSKWEDYFHLVEFSYNNGYQA
jgi:hypothetical protein